LSASRPPGEDENELPVVLARSGIDNKGAFSLHATTPTGDAIVDLSLPSTTPSQTLDTLAASVTYIHLHLYSNER